jgi:hypothetical protein
MSEVIYKVRVNRPCRLFIDDEEMMILDENKPNRQKLLRDGQLIILRDGKSYSVMGQEL